MFTRAQDERRNGLGDVVHTATGESRALVHFAVQRGDKDHRYMFSGGIRFERGRHLVTIHAWHLHVQQYQAWCMLAGNLQRLFAITRKHQFVIVTKDLAKKRQIVGFVVHTEDGSAGHVHQSWGDDWIEVELGLMFFNKARTSCSAAR